MAVIDLLPKEQLNDPKLAKAIEMAEDLGVADIQFFQIFAHCPGYAEALYGAMHESLANGGVDHKLKEIIRIQIARRAGDPYLGGLRSKKAQAAGLTEAMIEAGCGDFDNDPNFTDAEKWALRFAYLMFREPKKVNREFYTEGKRHFTEAQIMEIGGLLAVYYGMSTVMSTFKVAPLAAQA